MNKRARSKNHSKEQHVKFKNPLGSPYPLQYIGYALFLNKDQGAQDNHRKSRANISVLLTL